MPIALRRSSKHPMDDHHDTNSAWFGYPPMLIKTDVLSCSKIINHHPSRYPGHFSLRKLLSSTWQSSLLLHWMKVEMNPNIYLLDPRKEAKSTRAPHSPQMVWMIKSLMVMDLSGFHRLTLSSSRFLSRANPAAWRGESSYRRETVPAYGIERSRRYEDRQWLVNR